MESTSWFYLDNLGNQKGPIGAGVIQKLFVRGVGGIGATTLVWQPGKAEWQPLHKVEPFASFVSFHMKQWFYLDDEHQQQGPITSSQLLDKLREGLLDGINMVFTSNMPSWQRIGEIEELKEELRKLGDEESNISANQPSASASASAAADASSEQVFDPEILHDKAVKEAAKEFFSSRVQASDGDENDNDGMGPEKDTDNKPDDDNNMDEGNSSDDGDEKQPNTAEATNALTSTKINQKRRKKKRKAAPSTWIYITGLPEDITTEEVKSHFSKVGLIDLSPIDQQPRIKIYTDSDGKCKGDAVLCYFSAVSVEMACTVLDGGYIRPNTKITVSKADWGGKDSAGGGGDEHDRTFAKKAKISSQQVKTAKLAALQALAWEEDEGMVGVKSGGGAGGGLPLRIVVLENVFSPADIKDNDELIEELQQDIGEEMSKIGEVEKITLFSSHPRGVVLVKYKTPRAAQDCIEQIGGRFFGGRKLKCYYWDGVTNFSMSSGHSGGMVGLGAAGAEGGVETVDQEDLEEKARLDEFGDWLEKEQEELPEEFRLRTE